MKRKISLKVIIILSLLLISCVSFSSTSGATYLGDLISALDDFTSDGRKLVVTVVILGVVFGAIRYGMNQDSGTFISSMVSSLVIVAIVAVFLKIVVTVGGSTLSPQYIQKNSIAKSENMKIINYKTAIENYLIN